MKKIAAICLALSLQFGSYAQDNVVIDANVTPRTLKSQFDKIKVSGNIKLILSQSDDVSLAVSASNEKYIADISTSVENNTLRIYWAGDNNWTRNRELTVYLGFKQISGIVASGASTVVGVGAIRQDALKIDLSGASNLKGSFDLKSFTIDLSGASDAKIEGKVQQLKIVKE